MMNKCIKCFWIDVNCTEIYLENIEVHFSVGWFLLGKE